MVRTTIVNQSKTAFIEALFHLLESESFAEITVKQLILVSGYSKRTYYRYFNSKTTILDEMLLRFLKRYQTYLQTADVTPNTLPTLFLNFIWSHRHKINLLAHNNLLLPLITAHLPLIVQTLQAVAVPSRELNAKSSDSNLALIYSIGGFCVLVDSLFKQAPPASPEKISQTLTTTLNHFAALLNQD
ncbi:MAG: TetR/AcrR family transcriptional regulator [Lactobacillus sp.]